MTLKYTAKPGADLKVCRAAASGKCNDSRCYHYTPHKVYHDCDTPCPHGSPQKRCHTLKKGDQHA